MKADRHALIREIIADQAIETQEELAAALRERHIQVTQATVSRDIKEMTLIKVPMGDGHYRYAMPASEGRLISKSRMEQIFRDTVTGSDYSENIVVIKTLPGSAGTVASAIDHAHWPEIIGTVAGDDNISIVAKPKEAAAELNDRFIKLMR